MIGALALLEVFGHVKTAVELGAALRDYLESLGGTDRLKEANEVWQRSFRAERDAAVDARLIAHEKRLGNVEALVEATSLMVRDPQFRRLQANVEIEAARESTVERRRMLAHLAAGLTDADLRINLKARLERTARGLDPEDIAMLRRISLNPSTAGPEAREKAPTSYYALASTGCVESGSWAAVPKATPLGQHLLDVLETYVPDEQTQS